MGRKVASVIGKILLPVFITLFLFAGTLYLVLQKCCNGPSMAARDLLIPTLLETGQLKFLASLVCSEEEIQEIVNRNSMQALSAQVDTSLIQIEETDDSDPNSAGEESSDPQEEFDENGIRIEEISGRSFYAKMMIVKDPSQVCVGSTYPWSEYGKELDKIVSGANAVAGINGGIYVSAENKGGKPLGVVVQEGEITYNDPSGQTGTYMIGFNADNILIIQDLAGMTRSDFEAYVADEHIRDAVAFQEESSDKNNHFVQLIVNGEARKTDGQGSGANPRTAIGQRADGAVLMLVTDGRGSSGHLGATASDLIGIMQQYGAVNAANLDGGSSSTMVYNDAYEMASVTFYYQNSSWRLPTAFVVKSPQ
ncbi:MAG: phosphodiester glycosidase family protein [bacterium]|nr:phosphodiester glycosidase family protein [bacterium]MCM1373509.1 phosphodiester glycosidase family protein [Muribaculum sp.]